MAIRIGKHTLELTNKPYIQAYASCVGRKEKDGPLSKYFDKTFDDSYLGQETWEKAESQLQTETVKILLNKSKTQNSDVNFIFSGDLLNQCIASTFGLREFNIPFLCQYGACSTMAQNIAIASIMVDSKSADNCIAITSSHFCSAEKQFRNPLEYGSQRPMTAQWTVTGSGALLIGQKPKKIYIDKITIGKIVDYKIKDENNMGAVMAPAAADTLLNFFHDTKTIPKDYDLILTGDLGEVGSNLLKIILKEENIKLDNHDDCGLMIYYKEEQDVHAGGSGCGCSASVLCSKILHDMELNRLNNIIFMATGALMSPTSALQGESIPGVAHLINIKTVNAASN